MHSCLYILVVKVWLSRRKKRKMKGVERAPVLYAPWKSYQQRGWGLQQYGRCNNNGCHHFVCTSVVVSDNQQSEHTDLQYSKDKVFVFFLLTLALAGCVRAAPGTNTQLSAIGLREISNCCCAKSWKRPKLITIDHLRLTPWKSQTLNRLQSSRIVTSDRFCQYSDCLGEEPDFWGFVPYHLLRILLCVFLINFITSVIMVKHLSGH